MNVSRVYRLLKLITVLRSGRRHNADALAVELGVSRRTLFRDLNLLGQAGIPYQFGHGQGAYEISDSFFLPPLHLTLQEALALMLVTRRFLSRQVHPLYQEALEAALKIESTLPPPVVQHCGDWLDGVSIHWPPTSPASAVAKVFQTVQRALAKRRRVEMKYDSVYDGGEIGVVAEPLRLVFMSRGWYLVANSLLHKQVRTFKLDRVVRIAMTDATFEPDPAFSETKYFGAAWRMIPEGKMYRVKLRFSAEVASSVEEVRWHSSQSTTTLDDGRLVFEAQVDGLKEIASWILGYGDQVEVLEPAELRDRIRRKAMRIVELARKLDGTETA